MLRRWHHGHSTGTGLVIGILLAHHAWLLVAGGMVAGYVLRDLYMGARWVARWFATRKLRAEQKRRFGGRIGKIPY